jgi:hypothetical protein
VLKSSCHPEHAPRRRTKKPAASLQEGSGL